ncbi:MAG: hypothetical protein GYA22_12080 [Bacteroidales bacterium]|nr:hypothetical protein [Bacteroidales bacterium]
MTEDSYLFEQYLDGSMSEETLKSFLDRLATDKDFAARFELYKRLDDFVRQQQLRVFSVRKVSDESDGFEINELQHIEKEIKKYYNQSKNTGELRTFREKLDQAYEHFRRDENNHSKKSSWIGIAASIAILVSLTLLYFFQNHKSLTSEEIFSRYYSAYPVFAVVRGAADIGVEDNPWQTALKQYEAGNFRRAYNAFQMAEFSMNNKNLAKLYKGICLMELHEYGDAALQFQQILSSGNKLLYNQACWYLALCRIKQQRINDAVSVLKQIDSDGNVFYVKALQLLDRLDN